MVSPRIPRLQPWGVVNNGNSEWAADRCDGQLSSTTANCHDLVKFTANDAIHGGVNVANIIEVVAKGSHFDVSINGASVGSSQIFGADTPGFRCREEAPSPFTW